MKRTLISILLITIMSPVSALAVAFDYGTTSDGYKFVKHQHNEASYQNAWCSAHGGVTEYENKDFTSIIRSYTLSWEYKVWMQLQN